MRVLSATSVWLQRPLAMIRLLLILSLLVSWSALPLRGAEPEGIAVASGAQSAADAVEHPVSSPPKKEMNPYDSPPLLPQLPLFIFSLLLFWLFIAVMRGSAWQPLIAGLNERDARVVRAEQAAARVQHEAERLRKVTEQRMAEVHAQVKGMLAQARGAAEAEAREIVARAEAEAQAVKQSALAEIEQARRQTLEELSQAVDAQAGSAVRQLLG